MFNPSDFPNLLVGLGSPDDAAIWKLDEERALVVTTDFFTPVVDTPFEYGAIAAANSLSDIYAMGGQPFMALNVAALPPNLPVEISAEILRGGASKALEAGVVIAGGHTVQDKEPKFGMVVLGFVHLQKIISKSGAQAGDLLILTKPLGFGVTTTALKRGKASQEDIEEVIGWMSQLNKIAGQLAREFDVRGGTDITGFGLLGHASEIAQASKLGLQLDLNKIPFTRSAKQFAQDGIFPGGTLDNSHFYKKHVVFKEDIDEFEQMLLFDAQTSGGLLLSLSPDKWEAFQARAAELEQPIWQIGHVIEKKHKINVIRG